MVLLIQPGLRIVVPPDVLGFDEVRLLAPDGDVVLAGQLADRTDKEVQALPGPQAPFWLKLQLVDIVVLAGLVEVKRRLFARDQSRLCFHHVHIFYNAFLLLLSHIFELLL